MKAANEKRAVENPNRSSLRERIEAIKQEQAVQHSASGYEPVLDNRVTVFLPQEEAASPAATSEEAALGNYLNR